MVIIILTILNQFRTTQFFHTLKKINKYSTVYNLLILVILVNNIDNNYIADLRPANGTQVTGEIYYLKNIPSFGMQATCSILLSIKL